MTAVIVIIVLMQQNHVKYFLPLQEFFTYYGISSKRFLTLPQKARGGGWISKVLRKVPTRASTNTRKYRYSGGRLRFYSKNLGHFLELTKDN